MSETTLEALILITDLLPQNLKLVQRSLTQLKLRDGHRVSSSVRWRILRISQFSRSPTELSPPLEHRLTGCPRVYLEWAADVVLG
jgi:hypothetical protein